MISLLIDTAYPFCSQPLLSSHVRVQNMHNYAINKFDCLLWSGFLSRSCGLPCSDILHVGAFVGTFKTFQGIFRPLINQPWTSALHHLQKINVLIYCIVYSLNPVLCSDCARTLKPVSPSGRRYNHWFSSVPIFSQHTLLAGMTTPTLYVVFSRHPVIQ